MAICSQCGCEFDVSYARRVIGHRFGAGMYDYEYPDGDVCEDCASDDMGAASGTWEEMKTLPGDWDDD